ncbi:MAG: DNA-binding protein [Candidatus Tectimicrobiota bacterium]|nr:MAG: DNA-binding protein [Candidatus Tectomicrobia bacterium]
MAERSADWFRQAELDLEKARLDRQWGYYEWACFTAQQAAEKAVKAVYYARHGEARGHGVRELIVALGLPYEERLLALAASLDRFYIPTRYPNGLPAGTPHDYFTANEADQAIAAAEAILAWCQRYLP